MTNPFSGLSPDAGILHLGIPLLLYGGIVLILIGVVTGVITAAERLVRSRRRSKTRSPRRPIWVPVVMIVAGAIALLGWMSLGGTLPYEVANAHGYTQRT